MAPVKANINTKNKDENIKKEKKTKVEEAGEAEGERMRLQPRRSTGAPSSVEPPLSKAFRKRESLDFKEKRLLTQL